MDNLQKPTGGIKAVIAQMLQDMERKESKAERKSIDKQV